MKLLLKWRDAVRARLIDDWHRAHHFWTVRLATLGALIEAFAHWFPGMATQAWNSLPDTMRNALPSSVTGALPVLLLVLIAISRITKQKAPGDGQ